MTAVWHILPCVGSDRQKLVDNADAATLQRANDAILLWRQSSLTRSWDARQSILTPNFDGFREFDRLNVFGHRADPKKALPCVIARNLSHSAWKSVHGSLQ